MKKHILIFSFFIWIVGSVSYFTPSGMAQDSLRVVRKIHFKGMYSIPESSVRYYVTLKEGDIFSPDIIHNDVQRLMNAGLFESVRVETEQTSEGVDVYFILKEKPIIKKIVWPEKLEELKLKDVQDALVTEGIRLEEGQPFDEYDLFQAKRKILEMYKEKGFRFAVAEADVARTESGEVTITWKIEPGEDLRVGQIQFIGNRAYTDAQLRDVLKKVKPSSLWWRIWGKDKYDEKKIEEDLEKLKQFYLNNGYIDIRIGEPEIEIVTMRSWWNGKPVKRLKITIPIEEGPRYRVGKIVFKNQKVFSEKELRKMLYFKEGEWYNHAKIQKSLEWMINKYGEKGYLFANIIPETQVDPNAKQPTVNLVFDILERKPQYVRRIEFLGNTFTYDIVIRRELEIEEGQIINTKYLRRSFKKLFRLGYFDNIEPDIKPVEGRDDQIDIIVKLTENRRNQINFGGGYSELEGIFGMFSFSTRNLFGTGKAFSLSLQYGKRIQTYQFSLTDPYFLNRDIIVGIEIYNTWSNYFIYERRNKGGGFTIGKRILRDMTIDFSYAYSNIVVDNFNPNLQQSIFFPVQGREAISYRDSRIAPQLIYNSLSDPIEPTEGSFYKLRLDIAGGALGGEVNIIRPSFQITKYFPINRKGHIFAFNIEAGVTYAYGGKDIPFYERYYLGGDYTIRGYDFRTVGPIDPKVSTFYTVGGTKYGLFNVEYIIPLQNSPVRLVFFTDAGNAFAADESFSLTSFRFSTGFELRIIIPAIMAPIRIIFSHNWNRGPIQADPWTVRFGIGRSF